MNENPYALFVDGTNLIHRAYHSMPALTGPAGQPTGAVKGFSRALCELITTYRPTSVAVAFDKPATGTYFCRCAEPAVCYTAATYGCGQCCRHDGCTLLGDSRAYWCRQSLWASYKRGRSQKDTALIDQFADCRRIAEAIGCMWIDSHGWEADDVIASLCAQADKHALHYIVSTDSDLIPLVAPHIDILSPKVGQPRTQHRFTRWEKNPLYFAIEGGHNGLPGVRGLGDVAARAIAENFTDMDDVFSALADGSFKTRLRGHKAIQVARWQKLLLADPKQARLMWELVQFQLVPVPQLRPRLDLMSRSEILRVCADLGFTETAALLNLAQIEMQFPEIESLE